jgi:hypothetical protein
MNACRYIEIENHETISKKILHLVNTSLYKSETDRGDILFKFHKDFEEHELYNIYEHTNFWNFIDCDDILSLVPELKCSLDNIDVHPYMMSLLVITEGYGILHTDAPSKHNIRINIPILNCDPETKTHFFKMKTDRIVSTDYIPPKIDEDNQTKFYDPADIDYEIGHYILTKPVLFDYLIPHAVVLSETAKFPRLVLNIDFDSDTLKKV